MQNHPAKNISLDMNKWREIIEAWNKKEESQKAYCQRLGVNVNTFTYARSKLQQHEKAKTRFIPLTVKKFNEEKISSPVTIVLESQHGYKLHLPASLSLEQLTKLFKISGWNDASIS